MSASAALSAPAAFSTPVLSGMQMNGPNAAATKALRDIHMSSLPPGVPAPVLHEALGAALQARKLAVGPGNPIVHLRLGGEGHYAFAEFRTVQVREE
jgi:hypothetical protein